MVMSGGIAMADLSKCLISLKLSDDEQVPGWKPPDSGVQIDLVPSAAGNLLAPLTGKHQHFDDVAIRSTELADSENGSTELFVAQGAIPRDLFCRQRHSIGWRAIQDRAAHTPPQERFDRLHGFVGHVWAVTRAWLRVTRP
jgi:hypothetical protein